MSQANPDNLEKYRGTTGAEVKTANISGDDNPLKQRIGSQDGAKERIYDPKIAGERFVQFYDDSAAAIREYLSNSETACIRRARHELLNAGFSEDEVPSEVSKLLKMAKEECDYEPLIEVTYNRKPDDTRLIIEDNGIGISTEEYQVVQRIGYSTSHDEGSRLGNFGMGWMSGFQLTSIDGMFKMITRSYLSDEAYGTAEYVANFEFLDQSPDEYGTRFEFPSFGEAAKQIDIPRKVEEFTEGMPVPVLYRDFDEQGNETPKSDDYLATVIEDMYSDDDLVLTVENEFFKAVMSPSSKVNRNGLKTYNISMPIRRNTDSFGSNNKFDAPWAWDFRGKREDGPIVSCESDSSVVGLVPKEDTKYDRLMSEMKDDCIAMSNVPDDAIVMPEPASSRDSFKSGRDDFWKHVSRELKDEWQDVAAERLSSIDSWDEFLDMPSEQKKSVFRAYQDFGPRYDQSEPDTVQETLEENLGVTVPLDLCEKMHNSQSMVNVVSRGSSRAHTKGACYSKKIWRVIDEADDVYMAKTVSQKKADIVWGLGNNDIVRLKSGQSYSDLASLWGWKKAKDLPTRNLKEKLPGLDDDVIERYDNGSTDASSSNNVTSTGGNGKDPETYRMEVRVGSGNSKYISRRNVSHVVDKLENDEPIKAGYYNGKYLVIFDDNERASTVGSAAGYYDDIVAAGVPQYVYDYLEQFDNVYTSADAVREEHAGCDVTLSDGTTMDVRDIPDTDILLNVDSETKEYFDGDTDALISALDYDPDDYDRVTFVDGDEFAGAWKCATTSATVVMMSGCTQPDTFDDYNKKRTNFEELKFNDRIGELDKSSDEYEALFGYRHGRPDAEMKNLLIDIAQDAGLTE